MVMTADRDRGSPARIQHLDGLRGAAAFVVFMSHLTIVIFPSIFNGIPAMARLHYEWMLAGTPLDILWAANFAVCIFFVMSALVLSNFYEHNDGSFVAICARRYVRLVVPILATSFTAYELWASGAMYNLKAQAITQEGWLKSQYLTIPSFGDYLSESLYRVFLTPTSEYNPPLWTMKYEMEGSLGVFALYALVPQLRFRIVILLAALVVFFKTYYMCFVGGVLIYESTKFRGVLPIPVLWAVLLCGAYMGAFPYNVGAPENPWFGRMTFLRVEEWHIIGAIPLVFACMYIPAVCRFFYHPVLQYLGKISFSLYLIHGPLLCSFMSFLIVALYGPPHAKFAMFSAAVAVIPVTLACAHLIYKYVDSPAVELSRSVGRWIDTLSDRPTAATVGSSAEPSAAAHVAAE